MSDIDELIRQRAYELWEQSDKTQGSASEMDFWLQAERDIKQEGQDRSASSAPLRSLEQLIDKDFKAPQGGRTPGA